jgi:cellulose synthase/poly-beta-1,6-N-acetylglucosamine synthase-like glycosyltransferase
MRATKVRAPEDTLVEDAYISYVIHNQGGKIVYAPEAVVYVKYPTNMNDFYKQRKRTVGGFVQLWKYGVVTEETKSRSFWRELEYAWFPLKYAQNLKELLWSFMLYPIRLWLWIRIYWERKVLNKSFFKTWVRVESTK